MTVAEFAIEILQAINCTRDDIRTIDIAVGPKDKVSIRLMPLAERVTTTYAINDASLADMIRFIADRADYDYVSMYVHLFSKAAESAEDYISVVNMMDIEERELLAGTLIETLRGKTFDSVEVTGF